MQTIGILGGMSWESTALYYRYLNELVRDRLGGQHSARCVVLSVDFAEVERLQAVGDWDAAGDLLAADAARLQAAGADLLLLATNTMHCVVDAIEAATDVPVLHIADVAARAARDAGLGAVGLLGTAYTMEQGFYRERLARHGLEVVVPEATDRRAVHRIIYEELTLGEVREESRAVVACIVRRLAAAGAQGVVLGCTELELLLPLPDVGVPLFPTTQLHAQAAVDLALEGRDQPNLPEM